MSARRATMRNSDAATEIHEFTRLWTALLGKGAVRSLAAAAAVARPASWNCRYLAGCSPRDPSSQSRQSVPGTTTTTMFRGCEVRSEPILSARARRAMNVQLSPDKTADFWREGEVNIQRERGQSDRHSHPPRLE